MTDVKREIVKDALVEKVNCIFFDLTDYQFNTELEASNFITTIRELIEEYDLPKELTDKICILSSTKCKYFLCMEADKESVMDDTVFFGEGIELVATL